MKDWHDIHKRQVEQERRAIILEGATQEQFVAWCRAKKLEPGSTRLWAVGIVGPKNSKREGGVDDGK